MIYDIITRWKAESHPRANHKLDNHTILAHLRRSQKDRDAEREEAALEAIASLIILGIAGTFLVLIAWL